MFIQMTSCGVEVTKLEKYQSLLAMVTDAKQGKAGIVT